MKVSLIVITYNWPAALARGLASIAAQKRLPDEVLIADDGSGPETAAVIAAAQKYFPVPLKHIWHEDRGFRAARARNRGIAASKGDYIVLLDGDMLVHPAFIADHLMLAESGFFLQGGRLKANYAESQRLLAGGKPVYAPWVKANFHEFDGTKRLYAFRAPWLARWKARSRSGGRVMSCNMSFWREDLLRVNGFDERMEGYGAEDRELVVRLENAGLRRRALKWCALAMHLEHKTRGQDDLNDPALPNNRLLQESIERRLVRCEQGIDQHLAEFGQPS
jgi:glycosyltransferase involved in cell wall biosynthesis